MMVSGIVVGIAEILIFLYQGILHIKSKGTNSLGYNVILSLLFGAFNLSFGFSENTSSVPLLITGGALTIYYFYFIFISILPIKTSIGKLTLFASGLGVILFFLLLWNNSVMTPDYVWGYSLVITTFFCAGFTISIYGKWVTTTNHRQLIYLLLSVVALVIISALIMLVLEESKVLIIINTFYLLTFHDYIRKKLKSKDLILEKLSIFAPNHSIKDLKAHGLTGREMEIALLLLEGRGYQQIADELGIKNKDTVVRHFSNIRKKTNCVSLHQFVVKFYGGRDL